MVAITVILAAVIGAFVLEIGDQQETAPNTSFDSDQAMQYYSSDVSGGCQNSRNMTTVYVSHAGGDVLDITQTDISVEGNTSVWGVNPRDNLDEAIPQPDIRATLGTNEQQSFTSGNEWNIVGYNRDGLADENVENAEYTFCYNSYADDRPVLRKQNPSYNKIGQLDVLDTGNTVNVIWTASSGGKTQTLFRYTVQ